MPTQLRVVVSDAHGRTLDDATVLVTDRTRDQHQLDFDKLTQAYLAAKVPPGPAVVAVTHPQFEGQTREIVVADGETTALFLMAEPGVPTYFREKVRVPVTAKGDLIAVTLARWARREPQAVDQLAKDLGLAEERVSDLARQAGMRLYRAPGDPDDALARLGESEAVDYAGAVVSADEEGFSHLTRDIVVQFRGPRAEEAAAIGKRLGCVLVRELVYAPTTFVFRWKGAGSLKILEVIEKFAARDDVAWAEPSLVVAPQVDAVVPNDYLWPGCWDRQLVNTPEAWQQLQDAGLQTFGDPNILLAVWDSGVEQVAGVPTNADFAGTLSNGSPKNFASYDFDNMVANNNNPWGDHGSGVAGVAVALANNPAPAGGVGFGVAGSAPNVSMMSVAGRTPYVDLEVSDQYIWMAGFNPQSPLAGFPAPLSRGADVITCSLTPGAGAPLSGTARATLDFVTTFGRGGRGTLCFFSTGNQNQNNVTARPWGAYEKSFGIAGTTLANDGVTEVRATMSGWGQIALSSPTEDYSGVHNPPTGYCTWGAAHTGDGNLPSYPTQTTTLSAASVAGATTLSVASVAGFAANQVIHVGAIGANGSEPARISAVNGMTQTLTVVGWPSYFSPWTGGLVNPHPNGTLITRGPAGHTNAFGGTSSATPLAAGVAALVLSARPSLTFVQAREILRNTAVKFDLTNTDPVGRWLDAAGNPSTVSGLAPVKSGWYGYGRIDAAAAVGGALTFGAAADLVVRDNLSDTGSVPAAGAFWNSPDIWCRTADPASDPGALPATYADAGPHLPPVRGQSNWVYVRVRNRGAVASLDAWVRISIAHWPGTEFVWPSSFQPTTGPGDPVPSPLAPGTYLIGEAKVTGLAVGADQIVSVEWPAGMIPPETVTVGMTSVTWHPCLLAEITPHDGPLPVGNHVWDDNNLAQKNISIVNADAGGDFAAAFVIGNELNDARRLFLEVERGDLPKDVQLYVDLVDPILRRRLRVQAERTSGEFAETLEPVRTPARGSVVLERALRGLRLPAKLNWRIGFHEQREVVFLDPVAKVRVPIPATADHPILVIVGGIAGRGARKGEYEIGIVQRQESGQVSGSAAIQLRIGLG